jgi:hypothetical protein
MYEAADSLGGGWEGRCDRGWWAAGVAGASVAAEAARAAAAACGCRVAAGPGGSASRPDRCGPIFRCDFCPPQGHEPHRKDQGCSAAAAARAGGAGAGGSPPPEGCAVGGYESPRAPSWPAERRDGQGRAPGPAPGPARGAARCTLAGSARPGPSARIASVRGDSCSRTATPCAGPRSSRLTPRTARRRVDGVRPSLAVWL